MHYRECILVEMHSLECIPKIEDPNTGLDIEPEAEEKAKLVLLGKVLSTKVFSRIVVKEVISKAWNTINEVEVAVMDKNVFMFSFSHEVDVRRV